MYFLANSLAQQLYEFVWVHFALLGLTSDQMLGFVSPVRCACLSTSPIFGELVMMVIRLFAAGGTPCASFVCMPSWQKSNLAVMMPCRFSICRTIAVLHEEALAGSSKMKNLPSLYCFKHNSNANLTCCMAAFIFYEPHQLASWNNLYYSLRRTVHT